MPLAEDQPVPDQECWFRVVTNKTHLKRSGGLHHSALKGSGAFSTSNNKPWNHELSGRLVSVAGSAAEIAQHADSFVSVIRTAIAQKGKPVPGNIAFAGVACATAIELRSAQLSRIRTDVVFTPNPDDSAHSDFVTFGTTDDQSLEPVRVWLQKVLRVIAPANLDPLVSSCGANQLTVGAGPATSP